MRHNGYVSAGTQPLSVAVDPKGRFAYAANYGSNNVSVYTINQATGALTSGATITAGTWPYYVTVDPTGRFAYVANEASFDVSVYTIDQTTGALTAGTSVSTGMNPKSFAVDPTGRFGYAANYFSSSVSAYTIDQTTGELTSAGSAAAETNPKSVVVGPSGRFAYVANEGWTAFRCIRSIQPPGVISAGTVSRGQPLIPAVDLQAFAIRQTPAPTMSHGIPSIRSRGIGSLGHRGGGDRLVPSL
jgi:6-phosphogluconolactonase (cycloisomerase 2 family)